MSSNIRRQKKEAYIKQAQIIKESTHERENIFDHDSFEDMLIYEEFADYIEGRIPLDEKWGEKFWEKGKEWLASKLPQYKVGGRVFGKDKLRARAADELAKIMDKTIIKDLDDTINKAITVGKSKFPNNRSKAEFADALGEIDKIYSTIQKKVANCEMNYEDGAATVIALRKYLNHSEDYKLHDVYKMMKEEEESEDLLTEISASGAVDAVKQGVLKFFRADVPEGDLLKGEIRDEKGKPISTETIKGLKSWRLPAFLTLLGGQLGALSWIVDQPWFEEAFSDPNPLKALKYGWETLSEKMTLNSGEGLVQAFERWFDVDMGPDVTPDKFIDIIKEKVGAGNYEEGVKGIANSAIAANPADMLQGLNGAEEVLDPANNYFMKINGEWENVADALANKTLTLKNFLVDNFEAFEGGPDGAPSPINGEDMRGGGGSLLQTEVGGLTRIFLGVVPSVVTSIGLKAGTVAILGAVAAPYLAAIGLGSVLAGLAVLGARQKGLNSSRSVAMKETWQAMENLPVPDCAGKEPPMENPDAVKEIERSKEQAQGTGDSSLLKDWSKKFKDWYSGEGEQVPPSVLVKIPDDLLQKSKGFKRSRNLQYAFMLALGGVPVPPFTFDEETGAVETEFTGDNTGAGPNARQIINMRKAAPRYFLSRLAYMFDGVKFNKLQRAKTLDVGEKGKRNLDKNMRYYKLQTDAGKQKIMSQDDIDQLRKNLQKKWQFIFRNVKISSGQAAALENMWNNKKIPNFLKNNFGNYAFTYSSPDKTGASE